MTLKQLLYSVLLCRHLGCQLLDSNLFGLRHSLMYCSHFDRYGLILASKGGNVKAPITSRKNVFGDDSDADSDDGGDWVKKSLKV